MAWEGTLPELGKAGIFEKPDLLVFCHPHTKADLDAKIKKAERKFKPGEAVPLKSARHVVGNAELDAGAPNHFDPNKRGFSPK